MRPRGSQDVACRRSDGPGPRDPDPDEVGTRRLVTAKSESRRRWTHSGFQVPALALVRGPGPPVQRAPGGGGFAGTHTRLDSAARWHRVRAGHMCVGVVACRVARRSRSKEPLPSGRLPAWPSARTTSARFRRPMPTRRSSEPSRSTTSLPSTKADSRPGRSRRASRPHHQDHRRNTGVLHGGGRSNPCRSLNHPAARAAGHARRRDRPLGRPQGLRRADRYLVIYLGACRRPDRRVCQEATGTAAPAPGWGAYERGRARVSRQGGTRQSPSASWPSPSTA